MGMTVLVLAAGEAKRMGKAKQLLPYKGSTLLAHCLQTVTEAKLGPIFCVLGAHYRETSMVLKGFLAIHTVHHQEWANGIGSSISAGLKVILDKEPETNHIMVVLADQPLIGLDHLKDLAAAGLEKRDFIIATEYPKGVGVPAIFPQSIFDKIGGMSPETGAKKIIEQHEKVVALAIDEDLLFDVDTPTDFQKLKTPN